MNKPDKTDANGIAQILRTGWFSPVQMKSHEAHGLRALLSTRKALLKKTMDLANEVRGSLKIFGVRLPKTVKHGSFDALVRPMIEMDDVLAHAIIPLLGARGLVPTLSRIGSARETCGISRQSLHAYDDRSRSWPDRSTYIQGWRR